MAGAELTNQGAPGGGKRPASRAAGGKSPPAIDPMQDALLREVDEEIRQDRMKALWTRYRGVIIGAAVALVAVVAGYEAWKAYQATERDTASQMLTSAEMLAETDPGEAADRLRALAEDGPAGFALVARLRAAALLADQGDEAAARALYARVQADADAPVYRDLAAYLQAQSLLRDTSASDPQPLDDARALLAPLITPGNPWEYAARELDAVIALRRGDRTEARDAFAQLKDNPAAPAGIRTRAAALHGQLADAR